MNLASYADPVRSEQRKATVCCLSAVCLSHLFHSHCSVRSRRFISDDQHVFTFLFYDTIRYEMLF